MLNQPMAFHKLTSLMTVFATSAQHNMNPMVGSFREVCTRKIVGITWDKGG